MAQRPHDPYSPHDAVADSETPPAKKTTRARKPKPADVMSTTAKTVPVKTAAARKTTGRKTAPRKSTGKKGRG